MRWTILIVAAIWLYALTHADALTSASVEGAKEYQCLISFGLTVGWWMKITREQCKTMGGEWAIREERRK